jgi:hypothetical protein
MQVATYGPFVGVARAYGPCVGVHGPTYGPCVISELSWLQCHLQFTSPFQSPTSPMFPSLLQREWEAGLEGLVSASYLHKTKGAQAH